jgi:large subunit ribosomal protein L24
MNRYKKGDTVIVISGKDKGKSGKIEAVFPEKSEIIVEGINIIKKHTKATEVSKGGIIEKNAPFSWSKAMLVCPSTKKPTGVSFQIENGKKVRKATVSGKVME